MCGALETALAPLTKNSARHQVEVENVKREKSQLPPLPSRIIVMPRGDRDLAVAALKERFDLSDVRVIMRQVAQSLDHVHSKSIVHGDVKLLVRRKAQKRHPPAQTVSRAQNVVRFDNVWKLIDLDVAVTGVQTCALPI